MATDLIERSSTVMSVFCFLYRNKKIFIIYNKTIMKYSILYKKETFV